MGGSSSTQTVQRPQYAEDAMRLATQRANMIYEAGRMPFTGIDVVAINPAEQAAIDQAAMAATAFGMPSAAANPFEGMEMLESGGLRGYSSYPIYIADMQRLKEQRPDQYAALARQSGFDPITGKAIAPLASAGIAGMAGAGGAYGSGGADPNEHYDGGGINPLRDAILADRTPAEQQFIDDQLNLLHDGNHASFAAASLGQGISDMAKSGGALGSVAKKIFGGFGGA